MKEEKVKEIKQNAESLKNANGDTAVKIAAEINKNENTTDQTENATDTVDKLNGKKEERTHRGKCVYIHQRSGRNSGNLPVSR